MGLIAEIMQLMSNSQIGLCLHLSKRRWTPKNPGLFALPNGTLNTIWTSAVWWKTIMVLLCKLLEQCLDPFLVANNAQLFWMSTLEIHWLNQCWSNAGISAKWAGCIYSRSWRWDILHQDDLRKLWPLCSASSCRDICFLWLLWGLYSLLVAGDRSTLQRVWEEWWTWHSKSIELCPPEEMEWDIEGSWLHSFNHKAWVLLHKRGVADP